MKRVTTRRHCATTSRPRLVPKDSNCASSMVFILPIHNFGRTDEGEKAFAKIVAFGLATNSLSVKFLFKPGSLDFLADPKVSGAYNTWLRLVAREVAASKTCLTIVGHTSHTGTEQFNDRLSMQRAIAIQRRIEAQAPETAGRLVSVGVGFRENLVGSGTDDLRDALDRRVEFKVRNC